MSASDIFEISPSNSSFFNLKDAKVEYVGSAEEVEAEIKAKADVDQHEARLRVERII